MSVATIGIVIRLFLNGEAIRLRFRRTVSLYYRLLFRVAGLTSRVVGILVQDSRLFGLNSHLSRQFRRVHLLFRSSIGIVILPGDRNLFGSAGLFLRRFSFYVVGSNLTRLFAFNVLGNLFRGLRLLFRKFRLGLRLSKLFYPLIRLELRYVRLLADHCRIDVDNFRLFTIFYRDLFRWSPL